MGKKALRIRRTRTTTDSDMNRLRKSTNIFGAFAIGTFFCIALLWSCSKSPSLTAAEKIKLTEGDMIGRALILYANANQGALPQSIEELAPGYIGTNVQIRNYRMVETGKLPDVGHAVIASEKLGGQNVKGIRIRADGNAYFLWPGD
jgi:hypothetical protein